MERHPSIAPSKVRPPWGGIPRGARAPVDRSTALPSSGRSRPATDYADTGTHPTTTAVREERILAELDPWLGRITDPGHRADTIAAVLAAEAEQPAEPPHIQAARRAIRELPIELDRVLDAIRAGMDPELATKTTRQIQQNLVAAQATLSAWDAEANPQRPLTADDIATALDHAGDLAALLAESERESRARFYRTLDLDLQLDPIQETLAARLQLHGGGAGFEPATFGL